MIVGPRSSPGDVAGQSEIQVEGTRGRIPISSGKPVATAGRTQVKARRWQVGWIEKKEMI